MPVPQSTFNRLLGQHNGKTVKIVLEASRVYKKMKDPCIAQLATA